MAYVGAMQITVCVSSELLANSSVSETRILSEKTANQLRKVRNTVLNNMGMELKWIYLCAKSGTAKLSKDKEPMHG